MKSMGAIDDVTAVLLSHARDAGFKQCSSLAVGKLLSVLAAAKPGGRILELGTGVGLGTMRLLDGMSPTARLTTVEHDVDLASIAQEQIDDPRVEFVVAEGGAWLKEQQAEAGSYDLVFADTWPGKFDYLDEALALVAVGGFYVVDDLLPQSTWPDNHQLEVDVLLAHLLDLEGWKTVRIDDMSGVLICCRLT
ncbi:MAG: class I SAM-dependent methyltransferase [Tessaracoccus sp.]